jgi:adenine-specific DNA-methyltransferase
MPDASFDKFQKLLRELFQLDCQDLDFGVYRVLNLKRAEIQKFITERLPQIVDEAFAEYASADQRQLERELEEKRKEIESNLGAAAFDATGQLVLTFRDARSRFAREDQSPIRCQNWHVIGTFLGRARDSRG